MLRFLTGGFLIRFLQYISLPKDNDSYPKWPTNNGRILLMLAAVTLCPQQYIELSTSLSLKTHRHTYYIVVIVFVRVPVIFMPNC